MRWQRRRLVMVVLAAMTAGWGYAADAPRDSVARRLGFQVMAMPATELVWDVYEKRYVTEKQRYSTAMELQWTALPSDSDAFAADYGYPTWSVGLRYDLNHGVKMHREVDPAWDKLVPVDYTSHLGDVVTLYSKFSRPFFRTPRWEADYALGIGVGYSKTKYNTHDNIDDELIGSRWLIYFSAGFHATWRMARHWGVRGGLEFWHHSNGALNRPNKGTNALGPSVALVYYPYYDAICATTTGRSRMPFIKFWYVDVAAGVGAKTLHEEWQRTQFHTSPDEPDYRTSDFKQYMAYSFHASLMRRYARRWASGVGADLFYGTYADHVERMENHEERLSPWSVGVSARHEVFYRRLSMAMSLGRYLYRHMGENARTVEKPYYEHIGLRYRLPGMGGLYVGGNVKAHLTKADLTEFVIGMPIAFR